MQITNVKQQTDLDNLKNLLNQPLYFLSDYFKDLRTEVDVAFVKKGLNEPNTDLKQKIKENWIEVINRIDSFENECIQALGSNSFNKQILTETNLQIDVIESKLNENSPDLNEINNLIYDQVQKLERILFHNKFMIFLLKSQCIYTKNLCAKLDIATGVGKLIFITNEYLGRLSIYNLKKK
jgi:hypothetical protein